LNASSISPLCHNCARIDFRHLAWMNEPREYKAYPGVLPNAGCMNTTRSNFVRFRPKLGSVSGVLARQHLCSLCAIVARRIRQLGLADAKGMCVIQAIHFCTDRPAAGGMLSYQASDLGTTGSQDDTSSSELTTTRMAVMYEVEDDWAWISWSPERMLLQFQPCPTPVPNIAASIITGDPTRHPTYGGRLLDPSGSSPELLSFWLKRCEQVHGDRCRAQVTLNVLKQPSKILLIDVEDERIIEGSDSERYAALSYVWGDSNTHRLLKENYDSLAVKGALAQLVLPATIRDAMTVTRQMGVRFLWVDALCIIQDEGVHKQSQIAQMASIYMHSLFTIIAVAGTHADAGLPGVRDGTRSITTQDVVTTRTTSLIPLIDHLDYHSEAHHRPSYSTWYSRAWTMQEQIFSTRKLIFAPDQVYWHCPEARWMEETELEFGSPTGYQGYRFGQDLDPSNSKNSSLQDSDSLNFHHHADFQLDLDFNAAYTALHRHDGTQTLGSASSGRPRARIWWTASGSNAAHLELYRDLAIKYMNRSLTFESDRLNAFSGILTGLTALFGQRYAWALPESSFSFALTWSMPGGHSRSFSRHARTLRDGRRTQTPLPSWSWIAWRAGGSFRLRLGDRSWTAMSQVVFYRWDGAVGYRRVEEDAPDTPIERYGVVLAQERCCRWKSSPATIETGLQELFDEENDTGLLRFWTSTVPVVLCYREDVVQKEDGSRDSNGGGKGNGYISGFLRGNQAAVDPMPQEYDDVRNCEISLPSGGQSDIHYDLNESDDRSVTGRVDLAAEEIIGDIVVISGRLDWEYTTRTIDDTKLFALVVYWVDGIAYRAGILSIEERVWSELPNRVWKMVTLG
jgi:hypothetical protein